MADITPSPAPTQTVTLSDSSVRGLLNPLRGVTAAQEVTLSDAFASDTPDLVIYDSGAQVAGRYELHWTATGTTVAARSSLVRRNASNSADVLPRARIYTAANTTKAITLRVTLAANERFLIVGNGFGGLTLDRLRD